MFRWYAEHIEKAGVHSGDSLSILPAQTYPKNKKKMVNYAEKIVQKVDYKGLMNIQYIVDGENVYVLEVNPRASRTIPIVSKVQVFHSFKLRQKYCLGNIHCRMDRNNRLDDRYSICMC